jgi:hypothetical protein
VIAGDRDTPDTQAMINALWDHYLPAVVVLYLPPDESRNLVITLAPFVRNLNPTGHITTAYVCSGHTCAMPTSEVHQMLELLGYRKSDT